MEKDELFRSLNIFKAKEKIEVAGVVLLLIDELKLLCKGYSAVDFFIRPCTDDEIELDMDYDSDITDEVRNEMNRHEAIFSLTKSLFHYMDILKDDELTKINGGR